MVGALTLLVHEISTSFNITGFTLVVVDLIPTFAGIGLLLHALDVI